MTKNERTLTIMTGVYFCAARVAGSKMATTSYAGPLYLGGILTTLCDAEFSVMSCRPDFCGEETSSDSVLITSSLALCTIEHATKLHYRVLRVHASLLCGPHFKISP